MKKLTWALLSLMLLLGLGVASAQADEGGGETPTTTLPTPVFTPADGATVPAGTEINITLPDGLSGLVLLYTFDDAVNFDV